MLDLYNTALAYGATGDSTKNVNVTNWPVAAQETVWWGATSGGSKTYTALGFGHMHLTWRVDGLSGLEYVDFRMSTAIKNPEGGGEYYVNFVQQFDVTSANASGAMSFLMPAETFIFYLAFGAGTTATVYFAFYLTYA